MAWFHCVYGGGTPPTPTIEKKVEIITTSTSGDAASVKMKYYENGTLIEETQTIIYSSVIGRANAMDFHSMVKLYYDSAYTSWKAEALTSVYYSGLHFYVNDNIRTWSYQYDVGTMEITNYDPS